MKEVKQKHDYIVETICAGTHGVQFIEAYDQAEANEIAKGEKEDDIQVIRSKRKDA